MASSACPSADAFASPSEAAVFTPGDNMNITFTPYTGYLDSAGDAAPTHPTVDFIATLTAVNQSVITVIFDITFNTTTLEAIEGKGTANKASWIELDNGCKYSDALEFSWPVVGNILDSKMAGSFYISMYISWANMPSYTSKSGTFVIANGTALDGSTPIGTPLDATSSSSLPGESTSAPAGPELLGLAIGLSLGVFALLTACGCWWWWWWRRNRHGRSRIPEVSPGFDKAELDSTVVSTPEKHMQELEAVAMSELDSQEAPTSELDGQDARTGEPVPTKGCKRAPSVRYELDATPVYSVPVTPVSAVSAETKTDGW